jgi:RNA polymerase sigma-70 factor (ECF subfamily)
VENPPIGIIPGMDDPAHIAPSADFLANVTRAQRPLYGFIVTLAGGALDADDILQETNLVLWRKAAEYDPARDFMSWALRIAQLQTMAHLKKRRRRPVFDTALLERIADESVADRDEADLRRQALAACLQKLSAKHRHLVARRYEPGASVIAMAAEIGSQPKAVSEMLRRIRHALLECIERSIAAEATS